MLVVDEAHYVKNPKAQRSKAVYAIGEKADYITYSTFPAYISKQSLNERGL